MPKNRELSASVNNSSVQAPLFADDTAIVLTKESDEKQIKAYFQAILVSYELEEQFPINLDEVYMLAYSRKDHAVRHLTNDFIEGIDYLVFPQKGENPKGGRPTAIYMLSVPCLEYFIARKVRPVFEVYRKVFHKVTKTPPAVQKELAAKEREIKRMKEDMLDISKSVLFLTNSTDVLKAQLNTMKQLFEEELSIKCNLIAFLHMKNLMKEWEEFDASF